MLYCRTIVACIRRAVLYWSYLKYEKLNSDIPVCCCRWECTLEDFLHIQILGARCHSRVCVWNVIWPVYIPGLLCIYIMLYFMLYPMFRYESVYFI